MKFIQVDNAQGSKTYINSSEILHMTQLEDKTSIVMKNGDRFTSKKSAYTLIKELQKG